MVGEFGIWRHGFGKQGQETRGRGKNGGWRERVYTPVDVIVYVDTLGRRSS
jgi:hypothetical protein